MMNLLFLLLTGLVPAALAGDPLTVLGSEVGRPDEPFTPIAFVQPQIEGVLAEPVRGLQAEPLKPYNGERAAFNTVGGAGAPWSFRVFRARFGGRGSIPGTDQRVSWFFLLEAGDVALTRTSPVVPTDLSLTLSYIPGARVRAGFFKLPVMEEILPPVPVALEFTHFTTTLSRLLLENPIEDGQYTGGAFGFRDVGVQVFDGFQTEQFAGSYAVMVSNGHGQIGPDIDPYKDITGRVELAWVNGGERHQVRRKEVKVGGWHLQGKRSVDETPTERVRQGLFLHVEQGVAWGLVEAARGWGMLETGLAPPFVGGGPTVVPDGTGWGVAGQTGVRFSLPGDAGTLGLKGRYDEYRQQPDVPEDLRVFRTLTGGVEWNPAPKLRLLADYEHRTLSAPDGPTDAQTIGETMGDRVTLQVTARL